MASFSTINTFLKGANRLRRSCLGTKSDLQFCCCCVAPSTVSRGDSATWDWWAELWMATPGTCCHDDGIRICWVPVGQACWEIQNAAFQDIQDQILQGRFKQTISVRMGNKQKKSHAETKKETNWLINSTGNSTKPDKRATSPSHSFIFSIALQTNAQGNTMQSTNKWGCK